MFKLLTEFFDKAFKDEKTRIIFIGISFALYVIWSEWRTEVKANDSFILSELRQCQKNYESCTNQVMELSNRFSRQIDSLNKQNLEFKAEIKYLKEVIE